MQPLDFSGVLSSYARFRIIDAFGAQFGADVVPVDPHRASGVNPNEVAAEEGDDGVLRVPLRRRIEEGTACTGALLAGPPGIGVCLCPCCPLPPSPVQPTD